MADINKISLNKSIELKSSEPKVTEEKLREVADLYEKYFIKEMIKQMKSTLPEGGVIKKNNAEKIFQEQLDDQYSTEWNKRGSFGLSDMIHEQLMSRFGEQFGLEKKKLDKPSGPIPFGPESQLKKVPSLSENSETFRIMPMSSDGKVDVKTPWAGTLQSKQVMENDQTSFQIKHDNGLESQILIHGAPTEKTRHLSPGDILSAGAELAEASPASPLFWTIKQSVSE